jgi:hypothetical protein
MEVGEVAASAAGDQDFLPNSVRMIEDEDPTPALASLDSAHESCGTCAEDDRVQFSFHVVN